MTDEITRRLATIVMADVVGYSRLMGADERGTHRRVQEALRELIEPTIVEHHGRLVKQRGDGFLSMFDSPVEAVRCAIFIQQAMVRRNLEIPGNQAIRLRIGINLGDVIVEADDIYGDGVNIAARLEQLAEPGNIFISGGVYEQVHHKLVCGFQSLGPRPVKNIANPVSFYRVVANSFDTGEAPKRRLTIYGGLVVLGLIACVAFVFVWQRMGTEPRPSHYAETPSMTAPPTAAPIAQPERSPVITAPTPVIAAPVIEAFVRPVTPTVAPPTKPPLSEPEMQPIAGGSFLMGSPDDPSEQPVHRVTVKSFEIGKYPITTRQWMACAQVMACSYMPPNDSDAPVTNISWDDAGQYIKWLGQTTGRTYRLPTEAEWEYAARGGTDTKYWWGNTIKPGFAVCKGCGEAGQPFKVGSRPVNPFGLFDVNGGVTEWTEDCWFRDYKGAPTDGAARLKPGCQEHVLRGGSWSNNQNDIRTASRDSYNASVRYPTHGLRVARSP